MGILTQGNESEMLQNLWDDSAVYSAEIVNYFCAKDMELSVRWTTFELPHGTSEAAAVSWINWIRTRAGDPAERTTSEK